MNFTITSGGETTSFALNGSEDTFFAWLGGMLATWAIFIIALLVIQIIAQWKIFEKAGREGWKSLIPFYNMYVLTEISGLNGWLFLICLVPFGSLVWNILVSIKLSEAFGKSTGFAIGLILLPFIFQLILGFGDAKYQLGGAPAKATSGSSTAKKKKTGDSWVEGK